MRLDLRAFRESKDKGSFESEYSENLKLVLDRIERDHTFAEKTAVFKGSDLDLLVGGGSRKTKSRQPGPLSVDDVGRPVAKHHNPKALKRQTRIFPFGQNA